MKFRVCEFIGDAERTHTSPCTGTARFAVSVNGLSPLRVCAEHAKVMSAMWKSLGDFVSRALS